MGLSAIGTHAPGTASAHTNEPRVHAPGMMGTVMPAARQSAWNVRNTAVSKNICVMMKSAPASTFSFKYAISAA